MVDMRRYDPPAVSGFQATGPRARGEPRASTLTCFDVLPTIDENARNAGAIRAATERTCAPIVPYDFLIAEQGLARAPTLVESN